MNSCNRCGRSLSSNEESSSTGTAETRRSLRAGLSLAAATEGDGSSCLWRVLGVGRTLLSAAVLRHLPNSIQVTTSEERQSSTNRKSQKQLRRAGMSAPHEPHCPITPSRTPFSLPASNHATFCPNQVLVPESLYFLVAAAKSRVPSRMATGVSPNLPSRSGSHPPFKGAARMTGSPGKYASL